MTTQQNKKAVVGYLETAFNAKQPAEAVAAYVGSRYIQHNPQAPDGPEAFIAFVDGFSQQFPEARIDIKRVVAEDDLVVAHSLLTVGPTDTGTAAVDIFRLEDGRIVEHWDVLQPVPETAANDNTMF
ncbi:MAG: nuclear transport factor 2 family protein [Actinomycetota bacterium]|nr:nuclear transport factor 2 family protein [Actinomycetota bacterium]